jgi:putative peptidoglycan lipid II flippase
MPKDSPARTAHTIGRSAFLVAAGIFFSRIFGLVRESVTAAYMGNSFVTDAFRSALRIPNILQNLFGEGALSASFIPVYARLVAEGEETEAGRVAGAVFSLLALVTSILVLLGVLATPYLVDIIVPGFKDYPETHALTIQLVRIMFPGTGLLVLSAWCLGILNSHRRFFLSYVSPVIWNIAIILSLLAFRRSTPEQLSVCAAWGSVIGCGLQFLFQLPVVLRLAPKMRLLAGIAGENLRTVVHNFTPAFVSRGVNQISAFVDQFLASWLPTTAVSSLGYAQNLYLLPVSLFGMSVSAAELPAMSSTLGNEQQIAEVLRARIASSTRRIAFFVVPCAIGFLALGDVIVAVIYQRRLFTHADTIYVWGILAGSAVGLVASTVARLYTSAYYALRDTRTPLRFAVIRVALTTALGCLFALPAKAPLIPTLLGIDPKWGVAGLTVSAGFSAWIEFLLLRRGMNHRIGHIPLAAVYFAKLWGAAAVAAGVGWILRLSLHPHRPIIAGAAILIPYGLIYLGLTAVMGIDQAAALLQRFRRSRA